MDKIAFARLIAAIQNLIDVRNGAMGVPDIEYIEALARLPEVEQSPAKASIEAVHQLLAHMRNGTSLIEAIKAYRTLTGEGLKESKEAVERYWVRQQAPVVADLSHVKMIEDNLIKRMLTSINNGNNMLVESLSSRQVNALKDFVESFDNPITSM